MKLFSLALFCALLQIFTAYPSRQESKDCEVLLHLRVASVCNVETVLKTESLSNRLCMYMHHIPTDDAWVKGEFCPPPAKRDVEDDEDDDSEEEEVTKSHSAAITAASIVSAVTTATFTANATATAHEQL